MNLTTEIIANVQLLWDYLKIDDQLKPADLIFCLGSIDIRSAHRAAELYLAGYAQKILFSGGIAHKDDELRTTWDKPEAEVFADAAIKLGVPQADILLETKATNTGENIVEGYKILEKSGVELNSMILVQKPYMGRRTYATFKQLWPGKPLEIMVTSPQITFQDYFAVNESEQIKLINIMVGDLQRIIEYPKLGYQVYQDIPKLVLDSYYYLVQQGFTLHLIK